MSDQRIEKVRDLNRRIADWERVHDHEVMLARETQSKFGETLSLAARVVAIASIPSVFRVLSWCFNSPFLVEDAWVWIFQLIFGLVTFTVVSAGAARASALFSHFWFCRSGLNERRATITTSLVAAGFIFWWTLVLIP